MDCYPYFNQHSNKDLLLDPEFYEMAPCGAANYLSVWRNSREVMVAVITAGLGEETENSRVVNGKPGNGISTVELLDGLLRDQVHPDLDINSCKNVIDLLTQKFEIFRRLYDHYEPTLKRASGAGLLPKDGVVLFGHVLAHYAYQLNNPKYLSTLLKLIDAVGSQARIGLSADGSRSLIDLIRREDELVSTWEDVAARA